MNEMYIRFMATVTQLSAKKLLNEVDEALKNNVDRIHIILDSQGGNVQSGIAIHNYLKGVDVEIFTYNLGTVSSIAIAIYCAGKSRFSVQHASFFMHPITNQIQLEVDARSLHILQDQIRVEEKKISEIVADVTHATPGDVLNKMHSHTYLTSNEAKVMGLVQVIIVDLVPVNPNIVSINETDAHP